MNFNHKSFDNLNISKRNYLNKNFNGIGNMNSLFLNTFNNKTKNNKLSQLYEKNFSNKEFKFKKQLNSNELKNYDYKSQISCLPISNKRIVTKKYNKINSNRTDKILMDYYVFKDDLNLPGKCQRFVNKNNKNINPLNIELNRLRLTNDEIFKFKNLKIKKKRNPRNIIREYKNLENKNYLKNNKIKQVDNRHLKRSVDNDIPIKKINEKKLNFYKSNFKIE